MKHRAKFLIIALMALLALLWLVDFKEVYNGIKALDFKVLLLACLMQIITVLLINIQWYGIAKIIGEKISFTGLLHTNLVGTFVESITPSVKAGGEAAKVYSLNKKLGLSLGKATAMVGLQKTVSILAFFVINIVAISGFLLKVKPQEAYVKPLIIALIFLVALLVVLALVVFKPEKAIKAVVKITRLDIKNKWLKNIEIFKETVNEAIKYKRGFVMQLMLSFVIWGFFALKAFIIAYGLQLNLDFFTIAIVTYLTYMVAMVPLLPGGLGSFEGSMVFLMVPFGIPAYKSLAFAIALRFVTFWFVFLISAIYLAIYNLNGFYHDIKKKDVNVQTS
ncbi:flippase-like domain-containing protein [Alkaliphilus pronyensis]|uniref:Phosphatidylglycerol lysyltransferase n=1 Tax=Alkaliphilus pronyensis TaxID=1482732 RepID=A0A6I0F779_9FIRM|nr:lysylphosphatidylglycerol synthase transmembrane domain-containing protein [Alkaliphilus pronyensis]KAB3534046.1 flippase-like domain-containing protein [Alkaliphilus pronyensis]